jgi:hypothetical protein
MESKAALEAGIRAMRGNLGYYVGIDRKNNAISNVSLWESIEAAEQMATSQPMLDLASTFVVVGVRFQRPSEYDYLVGASIATCRVLAGSVPTGLMRTWSVWS